MQSDDKTVVSQQGAVVLSSVFRVIDHDDVKIWHVDASTKYADVNYVASFNGEGNVSSHEVWFHVSPSAMFAQGDKRIPTVLTLDVPSESGWFVLVSGGRYDFQVVAYKQS